MCVLLCLLYYKRTLHVNTQKSVKVLKYKKNLVVMTRFVFEVVLSREYNTCNFAGLLRFVFREEIYLLHPFRKQLHHHLFGYIYHCYKTYSRTIHIYDSYNITRSFFQFFIAVCTFNYSYTLDGRIRKSVFVTERIEQFF